MYSCCPYRELIRWSIRIWDNRLGFDVRARSRAVFKLVVGGVCCQVLHFRNFGVVSVRIMGVGFYQTIALGLSVFSYMSAFSKVEYRSLVFAGFCYSMVRDLGV